VQAVECSCTLGHQVFAPLGEQTQHLRCGFWIHRRKPFVARGGKRGGEGIYPVVLAGVASEAREHPYPRRKLGLLTSTTDSPEAANLPARCLPRPRAFSIA